MKGFIEKDLIDGTVTFEKIQIKEVTSHFRNGWVFLVVYPRSATSGLMTQGVYSRITSQKIKPLVIERVVVKAKKIKEKENGHNTEEAGTMAEENTEGEEVAGCHVSRS